MGGLPPEDEPASELKRAPTPPRPFPTYFHRQTPQAARTPFQRSGTTGGTVTRDPRCETENPRVPGSNVLTGHACGGRKGSARETGESGLPGLPLSHLRNPSVLSLPSAVPAIRQSRLHPPPLLQPSRIRCRLHPHRTSRREAGPSRLEISRSTWSRPIPRSARTRSSRLGNRSAPARWTGSTETRPGGRLPRGSRRASDESRRADPIEAQVAKHRRAAGIQPRPLVSL